jgi:hypothetical protein
MKIYIDNYDILMLKTKLNKLSQYKNNIRKKDDVFLKVITKENGIYNIYENRVYKVCCPQNSFDNDKITHINNYYKNTNLVLDDNEYLNIEVFSCIPLNHFYVKSGYVRYSLNGKASNVILIIEYIIFVAPTSCSQNTEPEENFIPVDFFFELRKNEMVLLSFSDDSVQEEIRKFLDILL